MALGNFLPLLRILTNTKEALDTLAVFLLLPLLIRCCCCKEESQTVLVLASLSEVDKQNKVKKALFVKKKKGEPFKTQTSEFYSSDLAIPKNQRNHSYLPHFIN